jgi:hypothetical protein
MYRIEAPPVPEAAPEQRPAVSVDLRCQICQGDMVAPSTPESRRHVALVCDTHFVHKACLARLPKRQCPTCKVSSESSEYTENSSRLLWQSGDRPPCGCGRTDHTRERAAKCKWRQVTCMFPGCTEIYFLHEQEAHYESYHAGEAVVDGPVCPYPGCLSRDELTLETFDAHVARCIYRPVSCVCGESTGPLYQVQQHQMTCKKIHCPSLMLTKQRLKSEINLPKCRHGTMACPVEALIRAVLDAGPERTSDLLEEIVQCRETYAL